MPCVVCCVVQDSRIQDLALARTDLLFLEKKIHSCDFAGTARARTHTHKPEQVYPGTCWQI
jgi:hypothetical protein